MPDDLVPLADVARELQVLPGRLAALSRRGRFPRLLKVTGKHYLVSREAVEQWKAKQWTQPET